MIFGRLRIQKSISMLDPTVKNGEILWKRIRNAPVRYGNGMATGKEEILKIF